MDKEAPFIRTKCCWSVGKPNKEQIAKKNRTLKHLVISLRSSRSFSIFGRSRERAIERANERAWGEQRMGASEKGELLGKKRRSLRVLWNAFYAGTMYNTANNLQRIYGINYLSWDLWLSSLYALWIVRFLATAVMRVIKPWMVIALSSFGLYINTLCTWGLKGGGFAHFTLKGQSHSPVL